MPTNSRNRKQKRPKRAKRSKPKRKSARRRTRGNPAVVRVAKILADPCNAVIPDGVYGHNNQLMSKFHRTYAEDTTGYTSGVILWCADFTPRISATVPVETSGHNLLSFLAISSSTPLPTLENSQPGITLAGDFLDGNSTTPAEAVTYGVGLDPATTFASSDTCATTQHISSCIKMHTVGKLLDIQGEVCHINGLTTDELMEGKLSIDDLFNYTNEAQRLTQAEVDIISTPEDSIPPFYPDTVGPIAVVSDIADNAVLRTGHEAAVSGAKWFGLAWRGLDKLSTHTLRFQLTKNIYWAPDPKSGYQQTSRPVVGPNLVVQAQQMLQKVDPDWLMSQGMAALRLGGAAYGAYARYRSTQGRLN